MITKKEWKNYNKKVMRLDLSLFIIERKKLLSKNKIKHIENRLRVIKDLLKLYDPSINKLVKERILRDLKTNIRS